MLFFLPFLPLGGNRPGIINTGNNPKIRIKPQQKKESQTLIDIESDVDLNFPPELVKPTTPRLVSPTKLQPGPVIQGRTEAQPQTQSQKCQQVARRRRRKGQCREGFFQERARSTKYITWRTVDCRTGREIKQPTAKKAALKLVKSIRG